MATWLKLFGLAIVSSSANAASLALVNYVMPNLDRAYQCPLIFLSFVAAIVAFGFTHKALITGTSTLAEDTINTMRVRFLERIQALDLRDAERINRDEIYVCVNSEMELIGEA